MKENKPTMGHAGGSIPPLLRWAGSKRKLIPELIKSVPGEFDRYIEPFSGSACLFFALQPERAILSDLNKELIDAYRVVRLCPKRVHGAIMAMPTTEKYYYELRSKSPSRLGNIRRAARFIYLNRFCFNGVFRTNQKGCFNVPRGTRVGPVPSSDRFEECAKALKRAQLLDADFEEIAKHVRRGDFVYLDPPYAKAGARRRGEYGYTSFSSSDLERLGRCLIRLDERGATFLLSYADCNEIRSISSLWHTKRILVRRHVAGFVKHRTVVRELLISNRNLKAPKERLEQ
jgi:DNA adenine methylase